MSDDSLLTIVCVFLSQYAGTQGYMDAMGVPSFLLPLVIITEVFGGLAIILGWKTRYVALALAGFSMLSALLFHADFSDQAQMTNFMKNLLRRPQPCTTVGS